MPTLYEDQLRLMREEQQYADALRQWVRRSMWISIFTGITVSTALMVYAWATENAGIFRLY